jgi:hypothetical protein
MGCGTARALALFAATVVAGGCSDLSSYQGAWSGSPVDDPQLLVGLAASTRATLALDLVDQVTVSGTLTLDRQAVTLRPLARAANDTLGGMSLPDGALRSYFAAAPLDGGDALAVLSLYSEPRVDLRLMRSDSLYAVFHLQR